MSWALVEAMGISGESRSEEPIFVVPTTSAALGEVSFKVVEVIQAEPAPEVVVVQPEGNAGRDAESKFWEKVVMGLPKGRAKVSVPRGLAPSAIWRVALTVPPHVP